MTNEVKTIKFCVGNREKEIFGYIWRLWWQSTSFYIVATHSSMARHKVSLHGPDPRHPRSPWLKLDVDTDVPIDPDGVAISSGLPIEFTGLQVTRRVKHVIRLRTPWDLFVSGSPSAPAPTKDDLKKKGAFGSIVDAPPRLYAIDLDIYLSEGRQFWPAERRARRDNAVLGPLQNAANQYLTAVSVQRSLLAVPAPPRALAGKPSEDTDRVRGVGASVDSNGVLWICEQWMSRAALVAAQDPPGAGSGAARTSLD